MERASSHNIGEWVRQETWVLFHRWALCVSFSSPVKSDLHSCFTGCQDMRSGCKSQSYILTLGIAESYVCPSTQNRGWHIGLMISCMHSFIHLTTINWVPALCQVLFWRLGFSREQERERRPGLLNHLVVQEWVPEDLTPFPFFWHQL